MTPDYTVYTFKYIFCVTSMKSRTKMMLHSLEIENESKKKDTMSNNVLLFDYRPQFLHPDQIIINPTLSTGTNTSVLFCFLMHLH